MIGRILFFSFRLFFGFFKVKNPGSAREIMRGLLGQAGVATDLISAATSSALVKEAYRRAAERSEPVRWRGYLDAIFEVTRAVVAWSKQEDSGDERVQEIMAGPEQD